MSQKVTLGKPTDSEARPAHGLVTGQAMSRKVTLWEAVFFSR